MQDQAPTGARRFLWQDSRLRGNGVADGKPRAGRVRKHWRAFPDGCCTSLCDSQRSNSGRRRGAVMDFRRLARSPLGSCSGTTGPELRAAGNEAACSSVRTRSAYERRVNLSALPGATHDALSSCYRDRLQEVSGFRDLPRQDDHRGLPAGRTPGCRGGATTKEEPSKEASLGTAGKTANENASVARRWRRMRTRDRGRKPTSVAGLRRRPLVRSGWSIAPGNGQPSANTCTGGQL